VGIYSFANESATKAFLIAVSGKKNISKFPDFIEI